MIRVATLDRRPAVRAGLEAILTSQPDLVSVGGAADEHELWPLLRRTRPDVLVLDDPELARVIKARPPSPKLVVYVDDEIGAPAGADGMVGKGAEQRVLLDAIRGVVHAAAADLPLAA
jgi:DNA-binding NarL/FixJ family response regulator